MAMATDGKPHHPIWDFSKYGVYWCGTRNDIMNAIAVNKSEDYPITDINNGCIYVWESTYVRKKIIIERIVHNGGYGSLTECIRHIEVWDMATSEWGVADTRKCYLKKPYQRNISFRSEAMLQIMAREALEERGFKGAIPEVYDIFKLPTGEEVFTMEYIDHCYIVHDYIRANPKFVKSDRSLATFFFQVAYYIHCLEDDLGLNHRDMKNTNILFCPRQHSQEYMWRGIVWKMKVDNDVVLVDFGFSCIHELRSGKFFLRTDICPKQGRDLFIFLCTIYADEYIYSLLSDRMRGWIEEHISLSKINIFSLLDKFKNKKITEEQLYDIIYKISEFVDEFVACSSDVVLDSLLTLIGSVPESPLLSATRAASVSEGVPPEFSLD
jgi:hypothetical protein